MTPFEIVLDRLLETRAAAEAGRALVLRVEELLDTNADLQRTNERLNNQLAEARQANRPMEVERDRLRGELRDADDHLKREVQRTMELRAELETRKRLVDDNKRLVDDNERLRRIVDAVEVNKYPLCAHPIGSVHCILPEGHPGPHWSSANPLSKTHGD